MKIISIVRYTKYLIKCFYWNFIKYFFEKSESYKKQKWIENYLRRNPECIYRNATWAYKRYIDSLNTNATSTGGQKTKDNVEIFNIRSDLKYLKSFDEVKEYKKQQLNLRQKVDCFIFGSKNETNVGTMLRTSELMGLNKMWIANCKRINPVSCVGANYYMNYELINIDTQSEFVKFVEDNNYYCVIIEQGGVELQNVNFKNISSQKKLLFMFGNESYGIPDYILNADIDKLVVSIPQLGIMNSLNVSTSHAIICWEIEKSLLI